MALQVANLSEGKVIGIGAVAILPGKSEVIPDEYERNPVLEYYKDRGFVRLTRVSDNSAASAKGDSVKNAAGSEDTAAETDPAEAADAAEALRKARLASLKGITEEALGKLAEELGISPANCKDAADMKKKVREALKQ